MIMNHNQQFVSSYKVCIQLKKVVLFLQASDIVSGLMGEEGGEKASCAHINAQQKCSSY